MPSRERSGFPDQERTRTKERLWTRTGKRLRTRTQLGPASLLAKQGQNSSGGGAPTAAATLKLQHPGHQLLFVCCRDSGRQFLVDSGFAATLWLQKRLPSDVQPVNITLSSSNGNIIPTFTSTMRELNLGGQMFLHTFICAKVKQPILGRDFLAENRLVEMMLGGS